MNLLKSWDYSCLLQQYSVYLILFQSFSGERRMQITNMLSIKLPNKYKMHRKIIYVITTET